MEYANKDFEHAYKQLEFAIRLKSYCEQGHLDIDKFDPVNIEIPEHNVIFLAGKFKAIEDIVLFSSITVNISFGALAIQLDSAFHAAGIKKRPKSDDPKDVTRSLVRMVRCAFAHNMAFPTWDARDHYKRKFELDLGNKILSLDMTDLDGKKFDWLHIGNLSGWYKICKLSREIIEEHRTQEAEQSG